ncbi:MAG: hypothetical protein PUA68_00375 [Bacilli bacterium]|nr:hypothetical protein [Bacilli bacterium]
MKKVILCLLIMICFTGCNNKLYGSTTCITNNLLYSLENNNLVGRNNLVENKNFTIKSLKEEYINEYLGNDFIYYNEITIAKSNDNNKKYEILLINLMENENVNKVVNLINNNIKYNKNEYEVIKRDNYILLIIDPDYEITAELKKYFKKY